MGNEAMTQAPGAYQQPLVESSRVQKMFGSIAHRYDFVNTVLSGGTHYLWRNALLRLVPDNPRAVALDVCTGTGDLLPLLKKKFGRVTGLDFCYPMLHHGSKKDSVRSFPLIQGDALSLPFADRSFDIITIAFGIRNLESLSAGLRELKRVLRPDGALLVLEFGQPRNALWRGLFNFYSATLMPLLGGLLSGNRSAYEYLPETSKDFPCRESFARECEASGLVVKRFRSLTGGIAYAYLVRHQA